MAEKRFKLGGGETSETKETKARSMIELDSEDINYGGWTKGRLKSHSEYSFSAKVFQQPSRFGIDGGPISKLEVRKDGERVANFDRGWGVEPQIRSDQKALKQIRQGLGDDGKDRSITSPDRQENRGR